MAVLLNIYHLPDFSPFKLKMTCLTLQYLTIAYDFPSYHANFVMMARRFVSFGGLFFPFNSIKVINVHLFFIILVQQANKFYIELNQLIYK